jgi:hypothetical protein
MRSLLAMHVTGLKNNSFNAIKVFKTKVTRSQRNGKDNAKMKYCRLVNYIRINVHIKDKDQSQSTKYAL